MQFVNIDLQKKYNLWIKELSSESTLYDDCVISIIDILNIYFSIAEYFLKTGEDRINIGFIGPRHKKILSNAVASQMFRYPKNNELSDDYLRCATLFYELIKSNPFYNCNKTTALISVLYYLAKINRVPTSLS